MEMDLPTNPVHPRVGLVYDDRMCQHSTPDRHYHPENPKRIKAIWKKLESAGIPQRCIVMNANEAEDKYIALVHQQNYVDLIRNISSDSRRKKIASKFNSIYLNKGSSQAAYLAAGAVIEVSEKVAKGELDSAIAIVRPPGHHAEVNEAMGLCLFNNVAIAASFLLNERPELGIRRILIVDWDVHHGNGTQKMFWEDRRVLFFSVHRFDSGNFYPYGNDGSLSMIGEGLGAGYNVNVPWEHGRCGDADYFAVWDHVLIPVTKAFNPDMILISGGFDAAVGDPLGGCCVTPYGYSVMMKKLMEFAKGRIVMALEGGYNLDALSNSVLACVKALLEDKPIVGSLKAYPNESTWRVIQAVREKLSTYWVTLADEVPDFSEWIVRSDAGNEIQPFLLVPHSDDADSRIRSSTVRGKTKALVSGNVMDQELVPEVTGGVSVADAVMKDVLAIPDFGAERGINQEVALEATRVASKGEDGIGCVVQCETLQQVREGGWSWGGRTNMVSGVGMEEPEVVLTPVVTGAIEVAMGDTNIAAGDCLGDVEQVDNAALPAGGLKQFEGASFHTVIFERDKHVTVGGFKVFAELEELYTRVVRKQNHIPTTTRFKHFDDCLIGIVVNVLKAIRGMEACTLADINAQLLEEWDVGIKQAEWAQFNVGWLRRRLDEVHSLLQERDAITGEIEAAWMLVVEAEARLVELQMRRNEQSALIGVQAEIAEYEVEAKQVVLEVARHLFGLGRKVARHQTSLKTVLGRAAEMQGGLLVGLI